MMPYEGQHTDTNSVLSIRKISLTDQQSPEVIPEIINEDPKKGNDGEKAYLSDSGNSKLTCIVQRSSNRLLKKLKKEVSPIPVDNIPTKPDSPKNVQTTVLKQRQPWKVWSIEDKDTFFEGLCEYGKDFESIQHHVAQKCKKKGVAPSMIKNKDQVRHFYYRTWHKISKFLDVREGIKKQEHELYGLINYAELRKKIGNCLNDKNRAKLNELIFNGMTTVKHKGKRIRVKTPVCRALKKLHNISDPKELVQEKIPKEIFVELVPRTNVDWQYVQDLAHNPRARFNVLLQKRLKCFITQLGKRWKPHCFARNDDILSRLPSTSNLEECPQPNPFVLRLKPPKGVKIYPVTISATDIASSSDVCLEKFLEHSIKEINVDPTKKQSLFSIDQSKFHNRQTDSYDDRVNSLRDICVEEINIYKDEQENENIDGNNCETNDFNVLNSYTKNNNKNNMDDSNYIYVLTPPKSVPEVLSPDQVCDSKMQLTSSSLNDLIGDKKFNEYNICETEIHHEANAESNSVKIGTDNENLFAETLNEVSIAKSNLELNVVPILKTSDSDVLDTDILNRNVENWLLQESSAKRDASFSSDSNLFDNDPHPFEAENAFCKTIRAGWTANDAGFLTFGELYLLLGKPATINLEYEFVEISSENKLMPISSIQKYAGKAFDTICSLAEQYFIDKNKQIAAKSSRYVSKRIKHNAADKLSQGISQLNELSKDMDNIKDNMLTKQSAQYLNSSIDKHVFLKPTGTAHRNIKPADQDSLREEIGKLLPSTRRGCRVRRKPLVVQRPLLPREGMGVSSTLKSMKVFRFIPSSVSSTLNGMSSMDAIKSCRGKIVDSDQSTLSFKQVDSGQVQNVINDQSSISTQTFFLNSTSGNPMRIHNNIPSETIQDSVVLNAASTSLEKIAQESQNQVDSSDNALLSDPNIKLLSTDILSDPKRDPIISNTMVMPDLPVTMLSSLKSSPSNSSNVLLTEFGNYGSSGTSCSNADFMASISQMFQTGNASNQNLQSNSPELQWLNGESTDLSLNTFLSCIESPNKVLTSTLSTLSTENSNLDPLTRLGPVVDSQVRCLLDECSIDFITKFEDLADVINSNDSKQ